MSIADALKKVQDEADIKESTPTPTEPVVKRGRGRPPGSGKNKTSAQPVNNPINLNPQPDPAIAELIKTPFEAWEKSQGVEGLKLTDEEANSLSKPIRQLMDYYLPIISPVGYVWLSLGIATASVLTKRIDLVKTEREKRKKPSEKTTVTKKKSNKNDK